MKLTTQFLAMFALFACLMYCTTVAHAYESSWDDVSDDDDDWSNTATQEETEDADFVQDFLSRQDRQEEPEEDNFDEQLEDSDFWRRRRRGFFRRVGRAFRRVVRVVARPIRRIVRVVKRVVRAPLRVFKKIVRKVGKGIKRVARGIGRVVRKVGRFAKKAISKVKGFVKKVGLKVGKFLQKYAPGVMKVLNSKWFKIGSLLLNFIPGVGTVFSGLSGMLGSVGGIGSSLITKGLALASKLGGGIVSKLASGVTSGLKMFGGLGKASGFLGKIGSVVSKVTSVAGKVANGNFFGAIKEAISQLPIAGKLMNGSVGSLISKGQSLFGKLTSGKLGGLLKPAFETLKKKIVDKVNEKLSKWKPFQKVMKGLGGFYNKASLILGAKNMDLAALMKRLKNPEGLKSFLKERLGAAFARTKLGQTFMKFRDTFESIATKSKEFKFGWQKIKGASKTLVQGITKKFGSFAGGMTTFKGLQSKLGTIIKKYAKPSLLGSIGKLAKSDLIGTILGTAKKLVSVGQHVFGPKFGGKAARILDGVQNVINGVKGAAGSVQALIGQGKGVFGAVKAIVTGKGGRSISDLFRKGKTLFNSVKNLVSTGREAFGAFRNIVGSIKEIVHGTKGQSQQERDLIEHGQMQEMMRRAQEHGMMQQQAVQEFMSRAQVIVGAIRQLFDPAQLKDLIDRLRSGGFIEPAKFHAMFNGVKKIFLEKLAELRALFDKAIQYKLTTPAELNAVFNNTKTRGMEILNKVMALYQENLQRLKKEQEMAAKEKKAGIPVQPQMSAEQFDALLEKSKYILREMGNPLDSAQIEQMQKNVQYEEILIANKLQTMFKAFKENRQSLDRELLDKLLTRAQQLHVMSAGLETIGPKIIEEEKKDLCTCTDAPVCDSHGKCTVKHVCKCPKVRCKCSNDAKGKESCKCSHGCQCNHKTICRSTNNKKECNRMLVCNNCGNLVLGNKNAALAAALTPGAAVSTKSLDEQLANEKKLHDASVVGVSTKKIAQLKAEIKTLKEMIAAEKKKLGKK